MSFLNGVGVGGFADREKPAFSLIEIKQFGFILRGNRG